MAWFIYLIRSLNKILEIFYLMFALSGLGAKNDVSRVLFWQGRDVVVTW